MKNYAHSLIAITSSVKMPLSAKGCLEKYKNRRIIFSPVHDIIMRSINLKNLRRRDLAAFTEPYSIHGPCCVLQTCTSDKPILIKL